MGFDLNVDISVFMVFIQGLLSFFSPCVFPLIPIYMGYLASGIDMKTNSKTGQFKVFLNTLCFIIGISCAFFVLGLSFTAFGQLLSQYRRVITIAGGIIIILFGLYNLGIFGLNKILSKEFRLKHKIDVLKLNPITALIFGFTFSFAWTPCVGPTLTSVLLMTSSAASMSKGLVLIGVYTLGFVIPFLLLGCFTSAVLDSFKKHKNVVKYTVKIGGLLMIIMGVLMVTGFTDTINKYLSNVGMSTEVVDTVDKESNENEVVDDVQEDVGNTESVDTDVVGDASNNTDVDKSIVPAIDFTLIDQKGEWHTLSDYKGKVVFLNFWATWCGPCKIEMPDIQALYEEYGYNEEDIVILGIANPSTNDNPNNADVSVFELADFLSQNNYTYPTVMDLDGRIFREYGITAFPTTFMIDAEGNVYGYITGALTKETMVDIIEQTQNG